MNKQSIYLPFAVLVASLAACSATPQKDVAGLSSGIDTANAGHYRQAIMHEEQAEKKLEEANKALANWKKIITGTLMTSKKPRMPLRPRLIIGWHRKKKCASG